MCIVTNVGKYCHVAWRGPCCLLTVCTQSLLDQHVAKARESLLMGQVVLQPQLCPSIEIMLSHLTEYKKTCLANAVIAVDFDIINPKGVWGGWLVVFWGFYVCLWGVCWVLLGFLFVCLRLFGFFCGNKYIWMCICSFLYSLLWRHWVGWTHSSRSRVLFWRIIQDCVLSPSNTVRVSWRCAREAKKSAASQGCLKPENLTACRSRHGHRAQTEQPGNFPAVISEIVRHISLSQIQNTLCSEEILDFIQLV